MYENCGKCLLKRHLQYKPNFFKIMKIVSSRNTCNIIPFFWELWKVSLDTFHNFKKIGFVLKVSFQKTLSTISIQIVENFEFMSIITKKKWNYIRTPFIIFKKLGLYWKCLLKRHFLQFSYTVENFEFWKGTFYHSQKIELY